MRLLVFVAALCIATPVHAGYLFKNGHFINEKYAASLSVEEHFQKGLDALKQKSLDEAYDQFQTILVSFQDASLATEAQYFMGVVLYEKGDLDTANEAFSSYLKKSNTPNHLEDVHRYKLSIAQKLAAGERMHVFGYESLPRWASGKDLALEIFDEISSALPNHELAAVALLGKATLLREREEFSRAVETYQETIRRFPKSPHALQAFLGISESYVDAIKREPQNVDALALAEINVRECTQQYPQATELATIKAKLKEMQEIYANALFETGQLYERMSEPKASILYYKIVLSKFPDSCVAPSCKERLAALKTEGG